MFMSSLPYAFAIALTIRLTAAGFGLVHMNSTDLDVWNSTAMTFM